MPDQPDDKPRGDELAARMRAARGWADLSRREMGQALRVSERQVTRLESGQADVTAEIRQRVAEACGVPSWFMDHGFVVTEPEEPGVSERLEALERQMDTVLGQLAIRTGSSAATAASLRTPAEDQRGGSGQDRRP